MFFMKILFHYKVLNLKIIFETLHHLNERLANFCELQSLFDTFWEMSEP